MNEMITITKDDYDRIHSDYKCICTEHNKHKGRRMAFLPGYGTTLFTEGVHYLVEGDYNHLPVINLKNAEKGLAYRFAGGYFIVQEIYKVSPKYASDNDLYYLNRVKVITNKDYEMDFALKEY